MEAATSAPANLPPPTPAFQLPGEPVSYSRVKTEFGQPLSSGISLPDMVENALRSLVEIQTVFGGGTGFIVNSDGLVVTNRHVVQGVDRANLRLVSGASYTAQVVDEHDNLDLAYLLIDSSAPFTPIAVGDSDNVRVGESVIVIGFPVADRLGSEPTVSQGIVSARRTGGLIQTDAPVNPGNSGGPMLDQFGNVIGVVISRVEESGGRDITGIGFAIPINEVKADLGGQVTPGEVLPTPLPTARPTIVPPIDLAATKAALSEEDAFLQTKEAAEYQAEQDRLEGSRRISGRTGPAGSRTVRGEPGGHSDSQSAHSHVNTLAYGHPNTNPNAAAHTHAYTDANAHPGANADTVAHAHTASPDILSGVGGDGPGLGAGGEQLSYA